MAQSDGSRGKEAIDRYIAIESILVSEREYGVSA